MVNWNLVQNMKVVKIGFFNKTDLLNTWQNNENVILVVPQKRKEDCLETLNIDLDKVKYKDFKRYIVIKR